MQTVYHAHTSEAAGKILKVKELVEVENVPASAVRSQSEQRWERRASRGYSIAGSRMRGLQWERTSS
jgi:large subunit ribosomal protein L30